MGVASAALFSAAMAMKRTFARATEIAGLAKANFGATAPNRRANTRVKDI